MPRNYTGISTAAIKDPKVRGALKVIDDYLRDQARVDAFAHDLLSTDHSDTTGAGSEAQGDMMQRGSSTWTSLAIGSAHQLIRANAGATAPEYFIFEEMVSRSFDTVDASMDWTLFYTRVALTAIEVRGVVRGSASPSVTIDVKWAPNRNDAGTSLMTGTLAVSSETTGNAGTLDATDKVIPATSWVWMESSAVSGTAPDELGLTVTYRKSL
jgi:hypothetical protein